MKSFIMSIDPGEISIIYAASQKEALDFAVSEAPDGACKISVAEVNTEVWESYSYSAPPGEALTFIKNATL